MLEFGKKYQVGNFEILKFTKALHRSQQAALRREMNIPEDFWKRLNRNGIPFIKISTIAGSWAIEYSCTTAMYNFLDNTNLPNETEAAHHLLTLLFSDTIILGDAEYIQGKVQLLNDFMARQRHNEADDKEEIQRAKSLDDAEQTLQEMIKDVRKEAEDGRK